MRKLFLLILFFYSFYSSAQKYTPFPRDSATWLVEWGGLVFSCAPQAAVYARYNYVFDGDTLIDTLSYKKVYKNGFIYSGNCYFGTSLGYQGAFREDTLQKRAFIVLPNDSIDSLLYDFNLNVGDTIKGFLAPSNFCGARVVTYIDSVLIGSKYRKQFYLQIYNCGFANYVEGIGSLNGLLEPYINFEWYGTLSCYWIDTSLTYSWNSNCAPLGIKSSSQEPSLKVFPIPSNDQIKFFIDGIAKSISKLTIFDIYGNEVFKTYFNNSFEFNLKNAAMASGMYYYQVQNSFDGTTFNGKILISKP